MRVRYESGRALLAAMALVAVAGLCRFVSAQERAIINNSHSEHSQLRSVNLSDVRWTDGFWKQKFGLVQFCPFLGNRRGP